MPVWFATAVVVHGVPFYGVFALMLMIACDPTMWFVRVSVLESVKKHSILREAPTASRCCNLSKPLDKGITESEPRQTGLHLIIILQCRSLRFSGRCGLCVAD